MNLRKFQVRDERDGWFGVVYHMDDTMGRILASPHVYAEQQEATDWCDYYEKNPPSLVSWILVGKA